MSNDSREALGRLREAWRYDPAVQRRIDADLDVFKRYVEVRRHHVALFRAPASEYDDVAVRAADRRRTKAHNEAILAASDLNAICDLTGREHVAPDPAPGADLRGRAHRRVVACYVADVLGLDEGERAAIDLR